MRLKAILGLGVAAATVVLGIGPANASATTQAPSVSAPPAAQPAGGPPRTITLITGDRLTVAAGNQVAIQRGPGRGSVTFLSRTVRGHLQVIPGDALPLLAAGKLDPRLFDVTTLLQFGYDDRRANLPLIVTYDGGAAGRTAARAMLGTTAGRDLPAVNG